MARGRPRPEVGWLIAVSVFGVYVLFCGVLPAGILTAVMVVILNPTTPIWMAVWIALTLALTLLALRRFSPDWYGWLLGRSDSD